MMAAVTASDLLRRECACLFGSGHQWRRKMQLPVACPADALPPLPGVLWGPAWGRPPDDLAGRFPSS
jgi:hypothetical protein